MYREMTDKEKLDFTSEIITAMQYGGFSAVLKLVEEKKEELDNDSTIKEIKNDTNNEEKTDKDFFIEEIKDRRENNNVIEEIKDKNEIEKEITPEKEEIAKEEHEDNITNKHEEDNLLSSDGASIYSKEALPLVKKDLEDQKNKMLSNEEEITKEKESEELNEVKEITTSTEENEINEELPVETEEVIKENKELSNDEYVDEEPVIEETFDKAPVLERKLTNNNPWSGIETVAPGTLKL